MSRSAHADTLPPTAKAIALLLSSTPTVQDAQPGVLHQLLEFSHRYTSQVLSDALVYSEHAGRTGKVELEDVMIAVQARVGWEYGGRVPKEHILALATQINAAPLPAVPEVFGVRLPAPSERLTAVNFDLLPNKPPPDVKLYDEDVQEIEESESEEDLDDEDVDMEPAVSFNRASPSATPMSQTQDLEDMPFPISAIPTQEDMQVHRPAVGEEGSDIGDDEDGLFAGGDEEEEEESDAMEEVQTALGDDTAGTKRKLVEEDDYD